MDFEVEIKSYYLIVDVAFFKPMNFIPQMSILIGIVMPERSRSIREEFRFTGLNDNNVENFPPILAY